MEKPKNPYFVKSFIDDGVRVSIWLYNGLPKGTRRAHPEDFYTGRPYLYRTGSGRILLSDVFRPATEEFIKKSLAKGKPIYIK